MVSKKRINQEIERTEEEIREIKRREISLNKRYASEELDEDIMFREQKKYSKEYGKKINKILKERENWQEGIVEFAYNSDDIYMILLKTKLNTLKELGGD